MAKAETPLVDPGNADALTLSRIFRRSLAREAPKLPLKKSRRSKKIEVITDPVESAKNAGLRYVTDDMPGIHRKPDGDDFLYVDARGNRIKDEAMLRRIKSLAIPPAWTDVWICPYAHGHLQASGRDAKKRKQYRYHAKWRTVRDATKFYRMVIFARALPAIRDRVEKDLSLPAMPREKILATVVRLLELTLIRIGNEEYARTNFSYGLTTLRNRHVSIYGSEIRFLFRGKRGKVHNVGIKDRRLASILKKCQEIPGYELFQYLDENGEPVTIDSSDVNAYLREITNEDFTAKDFRTWAATVLACMAFKTLGPCNSANQTRKHVKLAVDTVAHLLGNTAAICKKSYIHPSILDGYVNGNLRKSLQDESSSMAPVEGLAPEESLVLAYLEKLSAAA